MPQQVEQPNQSEHHVTGAKTVRARSPAEVWCRGEGSRGQQGGSAGEKGELGMTRYRALVGRMETQGPSGRRTERRRQRRAARIGIDRSDLPAASFWDGNEKLAACAENQHKPREAEA